MRKIDEQIKALLRRKKKIELYENLKDFVSQTELKDNQFEGLLEEFQKEVKLLVDDQIKLIENEDQTAPRPSSMVQPAQSKPSPKPKNEPKVVSPLEFVNKVKHLEGKPVIIETAHGEVEGEVTGMDAMQQVLIVNTVNGATNVKVHYEKVKERVNG